MIKYLFFNALEIGLLLVSTKINVSKRLTSIMSFFPSNRLIVYVFNRQVMDSKFTKIKQNEEEDELLQPKETWRIWKNVLVLGFAFMIHFTAFWGASNLQSSVNADESLGTFTLSAIYGSLLLSNIFLPSIIIK